MSFNECEARLQDMILTNNINQNFYEFVYSKIAQKQANRFVQKNGSSIDIIPHQHPRIKVIPICQNMDKEDICIDNEVAQAIDIIESTEFKYVYFVYPRNDKFDKHIQIKIPQLENRNEEYMVKLIPYSLKRLNKQNQCCGSCKD